MATPFSRTVFFKLMQQRENDLANRQTNESALMDQTLKSAQAVEEIKNKQFDRERQQAELMAQQAHSRGEEAPQFQNPVYSQASTLAFRGAQDDAAKAAAKEAADYKKAIDQAAIATKISGENETNMWGGPGKPKYDLEILKIAGRSDAAGKSAGARGNNYEIQKDLKVLDESSASAKFLRESLFSLRENFGREATNKPALAADIQKTEAALRDAEEAATTAMIKLGYSREQIRAKLSERGPPTPLPGGGAGASSTKARIDALGADIPPE